MEEIVLFDFIRNNYPRFTLNEIKRAFQLLVSNKLDTNKEHYDSFSPKYFSAVIESYREEAEMLRKLVDSKISQKEAENRIENTGEIDWSEEWEKVKNMAYNGEINSIFLSDALYNWMDRNNMITLSAKEKWQMVYQSAIIYRMELQKDNPIPSAEIREIYNKLDNGTWVDDPDIATTVRIMAKKECIKIEAYKSILSTKNNINE